MLDVDTLRAKARSPLAEVWLHGNLLYAVLLERRMRHKLGDRWGRLDQERVLTGARLGYAEGRDRSDDYRRLILEGRGVGRLPERVGRTSSPATAATAASQGRRGALHSDEHQQERQPIAA